MSKNYHNKAIHNKNFLESIKNEFPEDYFDWKVTVQFYTALHFSYCILKSEGKTIEKSHSTNINNLKSIDKDLGKALFNLYKNSRVSRYDGFLTEEAMLRFNKSYLSEGNPLLSRIENSVPQYYTEAV